MTMTNPNEPTYTGAPVPPEQPTERRRRSWLIPIIAGLGAVAVIGAVAVALLATQGDTEAVDAAAATQTQEPQETALEQAAVCTPNSPAVEIGDDGYSMQLQTLSSGAETLKEFGGDPLEVGITYDEMRCVLVRLDAPDSVLGRIEQTRALDGMQEATWGEFSASWTYHPDDGVSMVIEQR